MSTRWIIAIAVVVVGALWWARRARAAMEGASNPTGAPVGAGGKGTLAVLQAPPRLELVAGGKAKPALKLPPIGNGKVAPANLQQKPTGAKPPRGPLPPPKLSNKPAGAGGKKA